MVAILNALVPSFSLWFIIVARFGMRADCYLIPFLPLPNWVFAELTPSETPSRGKQNQVDMGSKCSFDLAEIEVRYLDCQLCRIAEKRIYVSANASLSHNIDDQFRRVIGG